MDCPRCDGPLERYALGGREAVTCESCGYIGVPVEHRGELGEVESWDDAISRFQKVGRVDAGTVETTDADPTPDVVADQADEEPSPTVVRVETSEEAVVPAQDDGSHGAGPGESGGDGVACDVCGKYFDAQSALNGHMAVHADDGD